MRRILFALALTAVPRAALACPVCFGQNDSPLASGINDGILFMLGIIAVLWVAFGSFFIYLWRRGRSVADGPPEGGRHVQHGPHGQEGTV